MSRGEEGCGGLAADRAPTRAVAPWMVALASAAFIAVYVGVAVQRIAYPFQLEWMEGGVVDHVERVIGGAPLYVRPSPRFVPFVYTPLYYWVSAVPAWATGHPLVALRAVSLVASLLNMGMLYAMVRGEGGERWAGVTAAGLFAACYAATGSWLDLARVDSLFLALVLGGALLLRRAQTWRGDVVAGLVLTAAVLTKQTTVIVMVPLAAWALVGRTGWRRLVLPLVLITGLVAVLTIGNATTDGWFGYYVVTLPRAHGVEWSLSPMFWWRDVVLTVGGAALLAVVGIWKMGRRTDRSAFGFHTALLVGMLGAAWVSRIHIGGYGNVLLPGYAALSLVAGLGVSALWQVDSGRWRVVRLAGLALMLAQLGRLAYDPRTLIPSPEERHAGERLVARIADLDRDVMVPFHGYLARLAGKSTYAHAMAVHDVVRGSDTAVSQPLLEDYDRLFASGNVATVILDDDPAAYPEIAERVSRCFRRVAELNGEDGAAEFGTITGWPTGPATLWLAGMEIGSANAAPASLGHVAVEHVNPAGDSRQAPLVPVCRRVGRGRPYLPVG